MAQKNNSNLITLLGNDACFDLQFRKDTRHERLNAPSYYRWKAQFIVTGAKEKEKILKKMRQEIGCGNIHLTKNQLRFSVQNINDIANSVVPFFRKHQLSGNKKKDFELWQKAVDIIYNNKGKYIGKWKKNDLLSLIQIHTSIAKYKNNPRQSKWMERAKLMVKI